MKYMNHLKGIVCFGKEKGDYSFEVFSQLITLNSFRLQWLLAPLNTLSKSKPKLKT